MTNDHQSTIAPLTLAIILNIEHMLCVFNPLSFHFLQWELWVFRSFSDSAMEENVFLCLPLCAQIPNLSYWL